MTHKKILAIYYSQTGQLGEIIDSFTNPLIASGIPVEKVTIKPVNDYPFPWTGERFYDVMPDCVLGVPVALAPFTLKESVYDLIILGYQSWFLSPSVPANSLLQHPSFKAILKDTPVITITGARNMWLNAFVRIKKLLQDNGANHVGNIALVDKHLNPVSYFTIFHWLLGGKKTRLMGIFPLPGVSKADIAHAKVFGETILPHLSSGQWNGMQDKLVQQKAVAYNYCLMVLEAKAGPQYITWANKVNRSKNRAGLLSVFKYYLHAALFIGAPVLLLADAIFIKPFSSQRIKEQKKYYLNLN
ncbi:MAG: hypothetical protein NVSMB63_08490 [Sediminibacterium sp.]